MSLKRVTIILVALLVAVWLAEPVWRWAEAGYLLTELAQPEPGAASARSSVSYDVDGRAYEGDLYLPDGKPKAGVLLVPGALAAGKDDARLIAFAGVMVDADFAVLVPDIPAIRQLRLRASDAADIADAIVYFSRRPEIAGDPLGIIAFSYAAGPALLAVLDPKVGAKADFVMAVGPYYDAEAVLTFFTTGYFRSPEGAWEHLEPNAYGKWLFVASNAVQVAHDQDRGLLAEIARRKLEDAQADVGELAGRLGPEGRSILEFVGNTDPARAPALIAALPEPVRAEIAALDLKRRDLSNLAPALIIVHGYDDPIIPYTESLALQKAVREDKADLYLIQNLSHVDLGEVGLRDAVTLWRAVHHLLVERDRRKTAPLIGNHAPG